MQEIRRILMSGQWGQAESTTSTATVQSEEMLAPLPTSPTSSTTSTATVQSEKILAPLSTSPTTSTQTTVQSEEILGHLPTSPSTPHAASSPAPRLKSPFKLKTVIKKKEAGQREQRINVMQISAIHKNDRLRSKDDKQVFC